VSQAEPTADELENLREQVTYLQQALDAVGGTGVDAVVIGGPDSQQIYTVSGVDKPYRVLVENMGEAAATVSEGGVVLYANPRFAEACGTEGGSMAGRDLAEFVPVEDLPLLTSLLGSRSEETRRREITMTSADGTAVPYLVSVTDLDLGEGDTVVRCLVLTDMTLQKLVERQVAADAARNERQAVAREVNDTIVQGLVAAEMALDLGQVDLARSVIGRTSEHARHWIGQLAGSDQLQAGMALRQGPARGGPEAP
jgi:PAS domain S-box-containing protein